MIDRAIGIICLALAIASVFLPEYLPKWPKWVILAPTLALLPAVALAEEPTHVPPVAPLPPAISVDDARCVIVGLRMGSVPGVQAQTAGLILSMYYLGKLDMGVSESGLEDVMVREITKMSQADYASEAVRCGREFQEEGKMMTTLGQHLKERGKAIQEENPSPSP